VTESGEAASFEPPPQAVVEIVAKRHTANATFFIQPL
jgi:hypothetical protein